LKAVTPMAVFPEEPDGMIASDMDHYGWSISQKARLVGSLVHAPRSN
jgi:hypothetical protein